MGAVRIRTRSRSDSVHDPRLRPPRCTLQGGWLTSQPSQQGTAREFTRLVQRHFLGETLSCTRATCCNDRAAWPAFGNDRARLASADLLGQPDENALGATDVAEPIHVFVLDHLVDELCAVLAEPGKRIVEIVH